MNFVNRKLHVKASIIACITFCFIFLNEFVDGSEHTIKTIQSANGEVIDCVDIYKQPAFGDPLLANHTIQRLEGSNNNASEKVFLQEWNKNGENCPNGTVPLVRTSNSEYPKKVAFKSTISINDNVDIHLGHEYAQVGMLRKNYGGSAYLNVWTPFVEPSEMSLAQIWVIGGQANQLNTIEAGWMVSNGGKDSKLFIYWTRDNYQSTGCYNLECPGFVHVNPNIALGGIIRPVSTYNGPQFDLRVSISKDLNSGNWWLELDGQKVGYWPSSIFTSLAGSSDSVNWGGEIYDTRSNGHHTTTTMGSGHFPHEGPKKASYFAFLKYKDLDNTVKDAQGLIPFASKVTCYDVVIANKWTNILGTYFFYGGPGNSSTCP